MHKHQFITIYQDGGTQDVCCVCGKCRPWRRAGERGSGCVAVLALAFACVFPAFVAWIIARELWGQAVADIAAALAYFVVLAVSVCYVSGRKETKSLDQVVIDMHPIFYWTSDGGLYIDEKYRDKDKPEEPEVQ